MIQIQFEHSENLSIATFWKIFKFINLSQTKKSEWK